MQLLRIREDLGVMATGVSLSVVINRILGG